MKVVEKNEAWDSRNPYVNEWNSNEKIRVPTYAWDLCIRQEEALSLYLLVEPSLHICLNMGRPWIRIS